MFKGFRGLVSLAFQVRRMAKTLDRLVELYEADLRSRGVEIYDPKRVGQVESMTEVVYDARVSTPDPGDQPQSFNDWLQRED